MECNTQLDHVVINVQRDMDAAEAVCARLGFTMTPRGYHSLGSINHLMMFDTDYFELIGVPKVGEIKRADLIAAPLGINGLVFKTRDVGETFARLTSLNMNGEPPRAFGRPIEIDGRSTEATFRTVTVRPDVFPAGSGVFLRARHAGSGLAYGMAKPRQRRDVDVGSGDRRRGRAGDRRVLCPVGGWRGRGAARWLAHGADRRRPPDDPHAGGL